MQYKMTIACESCGHRDRFWDKEDAIEAGWDMWGRVLCPDCYALEFDYEDMEAVDAWK